MGKNLAAHRRSWVRLSSSTLGSDDLPQTDDVGVTQVAEQLNLADGCDGEAFSFAVHPDLFQRHHIPCRILLCQVHLFHRQVVTRTISASDAFERTWT